MPALEGAASVWRAIAHPFLQAAANGSLGRHLLSIWLSQDRIYASHAYPRFIGALISHIPFGNRGSSPDTDAHLEYSCILVGQYAHEMARIGNSGNIEDGLVFLWAMEKGRVDYGLTAAGLDCGSEVGVLATNWSNPEFSKFVDDLASLRRAEAIWSRVVELTVEFWPLKGEGGTIASN
ncbi:hypothetical protein BD779DRAFT_1662021 [Infundibulicybe gibba]|nr:hypothetical protein BD779DRAFT_1662021 [Infundibulicybe gibba]